MTPTELTDHFHYLAATHRVWVEYREGHGLAWRRARKVAIPPIRGVVSYLVALHELGHVVGSHQSRSTPMLEREAWAWRWALESSAVKPSTAALREAGRMLRTYIDWAKRDARRKLPQDGSIFWSVLQELTSS